MVRQSILEKREPHGKTRLWIGPWIRRWSGSTRTTSEATIAEEVLVASPAQARSADTLKRITKAARELLAERDFNEISVDDIVARAGSSKGSFYHRFPDKSALLTYLLRLEHEAALERWSRFLHPGSWETTPLDAFVDAFVDRLVGIYRRRATVMRAYASEVFHGDGETRRLSIELNRAVLRDFARVVVAKSDEVTHPDPALACGFVITTLITLLPPLYLAQSQELMPVVMSPEQIGEEVKRLCRSYLGNG